MSSNLSAPFPYFGGKSKVAEDVWSRFGIVRNYIEPFCGSMAMLLHNAEPTHYETVNDIDGLLTNFWRAVKNDPEAVAALAGAPPSEIDLTARHNWVHHRKDNIIAMQEDPSYYDVEAAAYWLYVRSAMIGQRGIFQEKIGSRVPLLGHSQGIHTTTRRDGLPQVLKDLSQRLSKVRVCCGDWKRVVTNTPLKLAATPTAVFLDPPYLEGEFDSCVYEHSTTVFNDVRSWCLENGDDPDLRIALCGYEGIEMPPTWEVFEWSTGGGLGKINREGKGFENRSRERIWFSPHCVKPGSGMGFLNSFNLSTP